MAAGQNGSLVGRALAMDPSGAEVPLEAATVRLLNLDGAEQTTVTGRDGRYAFINVPPGRYVVAASRAPWTTMAYGARHYGQPGTPVVVQSGAEGPAIDIVLRRGGVIAGAVTLSGKRPAPGARMAAIATYLSADGTRRPILGVEQASYATADDQGRFRIFGLAPGDYWLRATVPSHVLQVGRLASAYFPGVSTSDGAQVLRVETGSELGGVSLAVPDVTTHRVSGQVVGALGGAGVRVVIESAGASGRVTTVDQAGRFVVEDVPAGYYVADARGDGVWGRSSVVVSDRDVDNVSIPLVHGFPLTVRVGRQSNPSAAGPLEFRVRSLPPWNGDEPRRAVERNGVAEFPQLPAGKYQLELVPGGGWQLHGVWQAGKTAPGDVIDVSASTDPVSIRVGNTPQGVRGRLMTPDGLPAVATSVLVMPAENATTPSAVRLVRPDTEGWFSADPLRPGLYRLAAVLDPEPGQLQDPAYLATLAAHSIEVLVEAGTMATLHLKTAW